MKIQDIEDGDEDTEEVKDEIVYIEEEEDEDVDMTDNIEIDPDWVKTPRPIPRRLKKKSVEQEYTVSCKEPTMIMHVNWLCAVTPPLRRKWFPRSILFLLL